MKKYILAIVVLLVAIFSIAYGYLRGNTPKVSVVMLTYKRADLLPRAIESILSQTYQDFEFIILNDGSPDNTDEVIAKYHDSRIRYYKNPQNKGIAYSRNKATSLARGKFVMIMDDDDVSLPERMQKQVEFLEKHPKIDVVVGQITNFPRVPKSHDEIAVALIQYNNIGNANIMYRKSTAEKNKIYYNENYKTSEDWDFWLKMLFNHAKFASIPDDILERYALNPKYYGAKFEDTNRLVRENVANFFTPIGSSLDFYQAAPCEKLDMIAKKDIISKDYIENLKHINHCY